MFKLIIGAVVGDEKKTTISLLVSCDKKKENLKQKFIITDKTHLRVTNFDGEKEKELFQEPTFKMF